MSQSNIETPVRRWILESQKPGYWKAFHQSLKPRQKIKVVNTDHVFSRVYI